MKSYQLTIDENIQKLYLNAIEIGEIEQLDQQYKARATNKVARVFPTLQQAEDWLMNQQSAISKQIINQKSLF